MQEVLKIMKTLQCTLIFFVLFSVSQNSIFAFDKEINQANQYYTQGLTFYDNKNYEQALSYFTAAIQADKTLLEAYLYRAVVYMEYYKDYDKAIADLNQVVTLDKTYFEAYYLMGACYFNKGDSKNAQASYNNALNAFVQYSQSSGVTLTANDAKSYLPYYDVLAINILGI
jgi:tetratricopeptide (TPR) repeat protein